MDSIEEKQQAQEREELRLSDQLQEIINKYGEDVPEDWVLIDERNVDLDQEQELDEQLKEWETNLKT